MEKKYALIAIVVVTVIMAASSFIVVSTYSPMDEPQKVTISSYTPHTPISLNGNAAFQGANATTGISTGSGTASDPYIIKDWSISIGTGPGIMIQHTGVFFVIKNVWIGEARANGGTAIWLDSVNNGKVIDSVLYHNYIGIYLIGSMYNTISNNILSKNAYGIDNLGYGSNVLTNNNCSNNEFVGIVIESGSGNTISNNNCSNNPVGIGVDSSDNTVSNNLCSHSSSSGIAIGDADNNLLFNNNCSYDQYGIDLTSANENTLVENNCSDNSFGMRLASSTGNVISDNLCANNGADGIYLHNSNGNILSDNELSTNGYGIRIENSNHNVISGNNCSEGLCGIYFDGTMNTYNTISGNILSDNSGHGAWCYDYDSNISDNVFSNNSGTGLYLAYSHDDRIFNNTFSCNNLQGIYGYSGCGQNSIWNNTFYDNNGAAAVYDSAHIQAYDEGAGNEWNSSTGFGNLWRDWMSPDIVAPFGIVDSPYNIPGGVGAKDFFPRLESSTITVPTISPIYYTALTTIDLGGTAFAFGLSVVNWTNADTGAFGVAAGTMSWTITGLALDPGSNLITVKAWNSIGDNFTDAITIIRDNSDPTCTITSPSVDPYSSNKPTINISGNASDNILVNSVTWKNMATGASGIAAGTTNWSVFNISLEVGDNTIYVNATDATGNRGTDTLVVVYILPISVTVSVDPTSGMAPLSVFFNCTPTGGAGPYTYAWTFGDGGTSTSKDPSHTYSTAGNYTAKVIVTDSESHTENWTTIIVVTPPPSSGNYLDMVAAGMLLAVVMAAAGSFAFLYLRKRNKNES